MTPEEIKFLVGLLPGFSVGVLVAAGVGYLLLKHFASGYLGQKGKNLADKEDITALTRQVEDVKRQQAEMLEAVKFRNQLRMAAIDRRLDAHQQAFALLRELVSHLHGEGLRVHVAKCQEWWEHNCLYLEPSAREAFVDAYSSARSHESFVRASQYQFEKSDAEQLAKAMAEVHENWARIMDSMNIVLVAVELPPLTEGEKDALKEPDAVSLEREIISTSTIPKPRGEQSHG